MNYCLIYVSYIRVKKSLFLLVQVSTQWHALPRVCAWMNSWKHHEVHLFQMNKPDNETNKEKIIHRSWHATMLKEFQCIAKLTYKYKQGVTDIWFPHKLNTTNLQPFGRNQRHKLHSASLAILHYDHSKLQSSGGTSLLLVSSRWFKISAPKKSRHQSAKPSRESQFFGASSISMAPTPKHWPHVACIWSTTQAWSQQQFDKSHDESIHANKMSRLNLWSLIPAEN